MMLEVLQALSIKSLIDHQSVKHLAENTIISPKHHPKIIVSVHLIEEDGMSGGVCIKQANSLN